MPRRFAESKITWVLSGNKKSNEQMNHKFLSN